MAKIIKYKFLSCEVDGEQIFIEKELVCANEKDLASSLPIAQEEAYEGKYTIEGEFSRAIAPYNIVRGEYVTIGGVFYKATENIPSGEPVIVGQNAVATTIEEQLYELKGE